MDQTSYRTDAYLKQLEARVVEINERGGIVLDQTIFYPTGGGQPGDSGVLELADGSAVTIATTVYGADRSQIVHVPAGDQTLPGPGDRVTAKLDWERRHRHMRVHTCMHLMCAVVPFAVTGGQVGADGGRLDFNMDDPGKVSKEGLTEQLNALISADHPVSERWISDEELAANPGLVRTMSVAPPTGQGRVRLLAIGEDGSIDLQPCGGTHVRSTGEIGPVAVTKIQNKGKQNRRIRVELV